MQHFFKIEWDLQSVFHWIYGMCVMLSLFSCFIAFSLRPSPHDLELNCQYFSALRASDIVDFRKTNSLLVCTMEYNRTHFHMYAWKEKKKCILFIYREHRQNTRLAEPSVVPPRLLRNHTVEFYNVNVAASQHSDTLPLVTLFMSAWGWSNYSGY